MLASIVSADPGIDVRPPNASCVAPPRPGPQQLELVEAFPTIESRGAMTVEFPPGDPTYLYMPKRSGTVYRFLNDPANAERTEVLDLTSLFEGTESEGQSGLMDMAFHPDFANNGELYVSYTVPGPDRTSYVARYVSTNGGASFGRRGKVILSLEQSGVFHGVGPIFFGRDGYLYIGMGDSSRAIRSQDPFTFNGSLLRIDVDSGDPYGIPADNPFAAGGGAPEVYAYGFRNPWRITQDFVTGDIWAGDVGDADWEEVNLVVAGGNYGWPIMEGSACVTPGCDTSGFIPPVYEYSHDEGCSVIGGYVYRGNAMPALVGKYVFTDLCSGDIMALDNASSPATIDSLLVTGLNARDFSEAPDGELYMLTGSENRIFGLVPDTDAGNPGGDFPGKLSETGCVDPSNPTLVAEGVIPYTVNTPLWSDGSDKRRWMAIPDGTQIDVDANGDLDFPNGTVLIKEFGLNDSPFETRLLVRHDDGGWAGYTYEWNDSRTDADLVPAEGMSKQIDGQLDWDYPSRAQCMECHNAATGNSIGPETLQLNGDHTYPTMRVANQLETLDHIGLLANLTDPPAALPALAAIDDASQTVEDRARSYLHANCAYCHRPEGPGQGPMDFRFANTLEETNTCEVLPENGDLGVPGAHILAPGEPLRSIMSLRVRALGAERMPPLGTGVVDAEAAAVIDTWISSLSSCDTPDTIPPTIPVNLRGNAVSDAAIDVSWDAATDDGGIASYTVFRNGEAIGTSPSTSYTDSGLAPATSYSYSVVATDVAGNSSSPSATFVVRTRDDATPPSQPSNLTGAAVSDSQIELDWAASADNAGPPTYTVFRNGVAIGTAPSPGYTDSGLAPDASYSYSVQATDATGNSSPPSETLAVRTLDDATPPSRPSGLTGTAVSDARIDLSWAVSNDNAGPPTYTVFRNGVAIGSAPSTSYSDSSLSPGTNYSYSVIATDATGNSSPPSETLAVRTLDDATPPSRPSGLTGVAVSDSRIDLGWSAASDNVGVVAYTVYRDDIAVATTAGIAVSVTGLDAATSYRFAVTASDARGNESPASAPVTVATNAAPPPTPGRPPPAASSGGGGSLGWLGLLLLAGPALRRRRFIRIP